MPNLKTNCAGIISPNPFWLASAPPTNSGEQIMRAFDAGWGGAVWKTLGAPVQNVSSRFGALNVGNNRGVGFTNIELISDRPLEVSFREIAEVTKKYPNNAVIVSLMVETKKDWREIIKRAIDAGANGIELNFGCPHGMCERGMGSAVGQEPAVNEEITSWAVEYSSIPVLSKLTPNVGDIIPHGIASRKGGASGVSLINTIKSVIGVDIDQFVPVPAVGNSGTNGGYCGAAVRPIALHMVSQLANCPEFGIPISGIGGITSWRDAVEFILLGATSVQVCTEVMLHGYRVVEDMIEGLEEYMRTHNFDTIDQMVGKALPQVSEWGNLDLNFESVAKIDASTCIGCQLCLIACLDGSHQCIHPNPDGSRVPFVDENECVGCNLCEIVCPVPGCVTMEEINNGFSPATWNEAAKGGVKLRPKKGSH